MFLLEKLRYFQYSCKAVTCILESIATLAQLVEQRFCKPWVIGSSPIGGSKNCC